MHLCISAYVDEDWSGLLRPTARRILDTLLQGPASFGELADATGLTKAGLQRPLANLELLGVISRTYRPVPGSREVVYALEGCSLRLDIRPPVESVPGAALAWASPGRVDPEFPLAGQVPKPRDREEVVTALRRLRDGAPDAWDALFVVLFGSVARGESGAKSDIDLLLVLPREDRALRERLADLVARAQVDLTLPLQPFFTTRRAFLDAKTRIDAAAARDGLILHGDPRERSLWNRMTRYGTIST